MECRIINPIRFTIHSVNSTYQKNGCKYNYFKIYRLRMDAEFTVILIGVYLMYAIKDFSVGNTWKQLKRRSSLYKLSVSLLYCKSRRYLCIGREKGSA